MRDVNGGDAEILLHFLQLAAQLNAQLGVQVAQRLIQADDRRVVNQRTGDGDALLLAARKLGHLAHQLLVAQLHLFAHFADAAVDIGFIHLVYAQAEGDIFINAHRREQGIILEHHADIAFFHRHVGDILALNDHAALGGLDEAGDGAQRGGFSASGGA